jgi:hypothetical protein
MSAIVVYVRRNMTTPTLPKRTFEIDRSSDDGLIRIKTADTGRVTLALSMDEASQIRMGLKGVLRPTGKKQSKQSKKRRKKQSS